MDCGAQWFGRGSVFGGGQLVVVALGYTAAAASSVQCFASGYRTVNEIRNPAKNDQLDSEEWYQYTMIALDAASLVGVGASSLATLKLVRLNKATTGKSVGGRCSVA